MTKLYVVPTPIGNLGDITLRALETLRNVNLILAEDTRTTGKLLKHFEIKTPSMSHHLHNEHHTVQQIVQRIKAGEDIAIVSDAGTPGISDPGFLLARQCVREGIDVEVLPGACAAIVGLVGSALPANSFVFEGFLPDKKGRQTKLSELKSEKRTMIFYCSPHKLIKTLGDFSTTLGEERKVCVCRELTKMFEEYKRGSVKEVLDYFSQKTIKGEIVIVVEGLVEEKLKKKKKYE